MSQNKLKEYQKQLFEYDYTLKKIDNILISARLPQEEREEYQLSREACQKAKNKSSQEMADYAKQNRLSLLIPPLSKEEKEEIVLAIETGTGESTETIRFDDVREEGFQIEETVSQEVTHYKTKKLNEYVVNKDLEVEDLENEDLENRVVVNKVVVNENLEVEDLENEDIENKYSDIEDIEKEDFDSENEDDFSGYEESDDACSSSSLSPEAVDFIKSLKEELYSFYGK